MTVSRPDPTFLAPGAFVDSDHPRIIAFAERVCEGATSPGDRASRLFRAVREQVRYDPYTMTFEPDAYRASNVLHQERAYCIPKAVLLAAVARAAGIPARLGFADVKNHLASPKLLATLGSDLFAFHGYVELWIDDRPIKVTPAFNAALCARFGVAPLDVDPRAPADALLQSFDGAGRKYMEYVRDRGLYLDLPLDEIERTFRALYGDLAARAAARDEAFHDR